MRWRVWHANGSNITSQRRRPARLNIGAPKESHFILTESQGRNEFSEIFHSWQPVQLI